ncbi:hypothetical protein METBIDRAFT_33057 [Metschnikowia bicuspidata var. bicuspidata NRRL YB-4993]|uniref:Vacuolar membrane protein n=1 Tax=Metschnikowia bicuspidata var. bicuspidata NRRL YB-4993 TaxID=869754 RepID=A0A1A0H880_9ASCO|nr:hypothetical protein METBIDRAFT_33057 [Metschnikowia bicuspidata var. bicuspidata NRRL YB-4993]OBA20097.1 hypothetical protein METBIDRAFT_33057 [Metschnikowia bicuspidata var. bicuspidata NRRL YB-4993]
MLKDFARVAVLSLFSYSLPTISTYTSLENSDSDGKCELVGTFSLLTQAFLGLLCLLSLIIKRFYENPVRRTWQVWFYDVSKQVVGSFGVHVFNLILSILKSLPSQVFSKSARGVCDESNECTGDPCDWYFLSIVLDCTIGVYILYLVLLFVSLLCKDYLGITQIESGEYGPDVHRPSFKAFLKQLALYFGSLMITKLALYGLVECFETQLLWITSHIILSWLDEYPNEFEIFVVMFVVPVFMNCLQLILVDNIIQKKEIHELNHKFDNERNSLVTSPMDGLTLVLGRTSGDRARQKYMSIS